MFISTSAMGEANTRIKLLKIDVTDSSIYKSCEANDIGMGAKLYVTQYKKSPAFKESVLQNFWKGVRCTLSALVSHMLEKSPLKYPFARLAACMSPNVLVDRSKKELFFRFSEMFEKLVSSERITVKEGDEAKDQYHRFIDDIVPRNEEKFLSFNKFDNRLDTFYAEFLSDKEFKSLWKVCILVFCLSHGQSIS